MNKKKKLVVTIIALILIALLISCTSCPATDESLITSLELPTVPDPYSYDNPAYYDDTADRYSVSPEYWLDLVRYIIDTEKIFSVIR